MKILLFTNSLEGGGAERVAATLANYWSQRHWQVTVVTLAAADRDFYVLAPGVRRVALGLSGPSAGVADALRQNMRRIAALRRVLLDDRPAVAVAMMSTPNVLLALASRGVDGLAVVGSERCYPPHFPLSRFWAALRRRMYGRLDAVVAVTQEGASWIQAHSNAVRVPVIPNAVAWPLPRQLPRLEPAAVCLPGRKVLLAVGRLDAVKNYHVLVGVFAQLASRHPDWDLVILGEGPQRPALEAAIAAGPAAARIHLPGIAGNVAEWYARARLYVMSSHSEGFPNSLAEALVHGLPAVSFDCDTGPRDIIRHGLDGLLVPVEDADALARALDRLMGDAALRAEFAAHAREARERFSLERIVGMWESLFREVAGARMAPPGADTRQLQERGEA